jgi:low affinity Fe/Cu permease
MNKPAAHDDSIARSSLEDATRNVTEQPHGQTVRSIFHRFSNATSAVVGTPWSFLIAAVIVIVWGFTGPMFHYSDTWQLVINTGTTIVTFLMVFLIQNTQNRDAKAIHLKLDELIRAKKGARNTLVDLENCTDEELEQIEQEFKRLRKRAERHEENNEHASKKFISA